MPPLVKSFLYPIVLAVLANLPAIVSSLPPKWVMAVGPIITAIGAAVLHQMQPPSSTPPVTQSKQ